MTTRFIDNERTRSIEVSINRHYCLYAISASSWTCNDFSQSRCVSDIFCIIGNFDTFFVNFRQSQIQTIILSAIYDNIIIVPIAAEFILECRIVVCFKRYIFFRETNFLTGNRKQICFLFHPCFRFIFADFLKMIYHRQTIQFSISVVIFIINSVILDSLMNRFSGRRVIILNCYVFCVIVTVFYFIPFFEYNVLITKIFNSIKERTIRTGVWKYLVIFKKQFL